MRVALLLIALATTTDGEASLAYDGAWRASCGDPARWSDIQIAGPIGTVRRIVSGDQLELETDSGSTVVFSLAGIRPASTARRELTVLAVERTAETFGRGDRDREVSTGTVHVAGKNIAVQLLLSGAASFRSSKSLTSFDRCLYERAEAAAREAHVGIWRSKH